MTFSSVQFSRLVVSDPLQPHESQHVRPPCPSPTPGVHSDSRPLSQWCHPAISSSVVPFSSCPQTLPTSESVPMSQLFAWGGQSTGVSASASFLPKKSQGWSPSEWTGWISLQSKGLSNPRPQQWMLGVLTTGLPGIPCPTLFYSSSGSTSFTAGYSWAKPLSWKEDGAHGTGPRHGGWCDTQKKNSKPDFFRFSISTFSDSSANSKICYHFKA